MRNTSNSTFSKISHLLYFSLTDSESNNIKWSGHVFHGGIRYSRTHYACYVSTSGQSHESTCNPRWVRKKQPKNPSISRWHTWRFPSGLLKTCSLVHSDLWCLEVFSENVKNYQGLYHSDLWKNHTNTSKRSLQPVINTYWFYIVQLTDAMRQEYLPYVYFA